MNKYIKYLVFASYAFSTIAWADPVVGENRFPTECQDAYKIHNNLQALTTVIANREKGIANLDKMQNAAMRDRTKSMIESANQIAKAQREELQKAWDKKAAAGDCPQSHMSEIEKMAPSKSISVATEGTVQGGKVSESSSSIRVEDK